MEIEDDGRDHNRENGDDTSSTDGLRGCTCAKKVLTAKKRGTKLLIDFNTKSQPIGENGKLFISYIGAFTRQIVPIEYECWNDVPDEFTDFIWNDIKKTFEWGRNHKKNLKKDVLQRAAKAFRTFKVDLGRKHLRDKDGTINEEPPKKYTFIAQESWDVFVARRQDPNFLALSDTNREKAKKPDYPYRASRNGYSGLEYDSLTADGKDPTKESLPREVLWKKGHMNKKGEIVDESSKSVVQQIDFLSQQETQEGVSKRNDILSKVINKKEKGGFVRGVGDGVTQKEYYGHENLATRYVEEVTTLREQMSLMQKELLDLKQIVNNPLQVVNDPKQVEEIFPRSDKGSCTRPQKEKSSPMDTPFVEATSPLKALSPKPTASSSPLDCQLYLEKKCVKCVAVGKIFSGPPNQPMILHCKVLDCSLAKVLITHAYMPKTPLPIPLEDEAFTLGEGVGNFVAWPKDFIKMGKPESSSGIGNKNEKETSVNGRPLYPNFNVMRSKSLPQSKNISSLPFNLDMVEVFPRQLNVIAKYAKKMSKDELVYIPMEKDVVFYEHIVHIGLEEISQLLKQEQVGASHISVYIRLLHEDLIARGHLKIFGFVCPHQISPESVVDHEERGRYVANLLMQKAIPNKLFLAPYNAGRHWVLIVIDPQRLICYYLDPLHGNVRPDVLKVIEIALAIFGAQHQSKKNAIRWKKIMVNMLYFTFTFS